MVVLGSTRLSEYLLEVVSAGSTSLISSGCLSLSGTSSLFAALLKAGGGSLVIRNGIERWSFHTFITVSFSISSWLWTSRFCISAWARGMSLGLGVGIRYLTASEAKPGSKGVVLG